MRNDLSIQAILRVHPNNLRYRSVGITDERNVAGKGLDGMIYIPCFMTISLGTQGILRLFSQQLKLYF
jgi:hypothetical protein